MADAGAAQGHDFSVDAETVHRVELELANAKPDGRLVDLRVIAGRGDHGAVEVRVVDAPSRGGGEVQPHPGHCALSAGHGDRCGSLSAHGTVRRLQLNIDPKAIGSGALVAYRDGHLYRTQVILDIGRGHHHTISSQVH